jgi:acetylornithine deacetylase/succinyl-diaminopimelate desuccinylase-like protein
MPTGLRLKRAKNPKICRKNNRRLSRCLWRMVGRRARQADCLGLRPLRRGSGRNGRWLAYAPFEPVEKDGKIYARGATDDKGQLFIHVKALESYLQTAGHAPVNVKFLIEGEEEVSSPNLVPFLKEHLELLRADVCIISDTSMRTIEEPAILHSLRGMTYLEVEVQGPTDDLHSGLWGGAVHNPALALVEILGKLYNPDNTIAVPGFYDDVVPLTAEERAMIAKTDLSEAQYKQSTGVTAVWGDANYTIRERISARPTLDINGLWSGWSGPGPKTIVPAKAGANSAPGWWATRTRTKSTSRSKATSSPSPRQPSPSRCG